MTVAVWTVTLLPSFSTFSLLELFPKVRMPLVSYANTYADVADHVGFGVDPPVNAKFFRLLSLGFARIFTIIQPICSTLGKVGNSETYFQILLHPGTGYVVGRFKRTYSAVNKRDKEAKPLHTGPTFFPNPCAHPFQGRPSQTDCVIWDEVS